MLIHWLWLANRPNMSDRVKAALMEHFRDAEDVYFAAPEGFLSLEFLDKDAVQSLQDKNLKPAQALLDACAKKEIHILTFQDAAYPSRLKNIPDPPMVLYYKGRLPDWDSLPLIGVVGTRNASAYGLTAAKRMGYQIAACGGVVVSGLAFGIDGVAMAGALSADMPVVGVLGCGADIVYPLSNKALFSDVIRNGCLLTEFPPGTPPHKWNFPRRNRIISGLSCGVLVVEAPKKSGSLITAQRAADQGRDVFVVPGNIDVESCKGSNALLRDGAIAATSGWDVISEYEAQFPDKIRKNERPAHMRAYADEVEKQTQLPMVAQKTRLFDKAKKEKAASKKKDIDKSAAATYSDAEEKLPALEPLEAQIVACMKNGMCQVDDIIAQCAKPAASVLASLTMLQIKGVVKSLPGKRVELAKGKK